MRSSTRRTIFCLPTKTPVPLARRVTRISSSPVGFSASTSARDSPSSAPASRMSMPGPMIAAISGTMSARGDWPMVTSPATGRSALVIESLLEHVQERAGVEWVGFPDSVVRDPAPRLGRVGRLQQRPGLAVLEEAAQVQAAGPAHLDRRELGHVVLGHRALDDGDGAGA